VNWQVCPFDEIDLASWIWRVRIWWHLVASYFKKLFDCKTTFEFFIHHPFWATKIIKSTLGFWAWEYVWNYILILSDGLIWSIEKKISIFNLVRIFGSLTVFFHSVNYQIFWLWKVESWNFFLFFMTARSFCFDFLHNQLLEIPDFKLTDVWVTYGYINASFHIKYSKILH